MASTQFAQHDPLTKFWFGRDARSPTMMGDLLGILSLPAGVSNSGRSNGGNVEGVGS